MRTHLLLVFALLSASIASASVAPVVPTYVSECHTTTQLNSNSLFVSVMNRCIAINSKISLPLDIVHQITDWLQSRLYLQYCLLVLLAFSVLISTREDSLQLEVLASLSHIRFSVALLLIRIASAITLATCLQLAFQQPSPCMCLIEYGSDFSVPVGTVWGLPNTEILVATLLALFLIQKISIPVGIAIFILSTTAQIIGGYASLGQTLLAVALGIFLHYYHAFTPVWWRLADFALNLMGGFVAFFVVRHYHHYIDISFSVLIWVGLIWMLFGFLYCYFVFEGEVLSAVLLRPSRRLEDQQFLRYVPISAEGAQRRLVEKLSTGALMGLLLCALTALRSIASSGFLQ